jgi:hypothetical protein
LSDGELFFRSEVVVEEAVEEVLFELPQQPPLVVLACRQCREPMTRMTTL